MKLLSQFTYSAIALIITANLSQSVGLGSTCTGDGNNGKCVSNCGYRQVSFDSNCDRGVCCGYVKCKEKNTGFNCMTESDCTGSTDQGGVCPGSSKCCVHLRGAIPSPELAADNSFSSFPADTVAENPVIDNPAPGALSAFNIPPPSLAEDDSQNQNWAYLGRAGTQQADGVNQQPEAVAAIANQGLWNDVPLE